MARAGLYHSDVKKARDALLAQGRHPSVNAVRVALGNTGSKTTIHKYLKELEAEEGGRDGRKAPISDALQDIVARLAARLHEEANEQVSVIETAIAQKERGHAVTVAGLRQELASLEEQLRQAKDHVDEIARNSLEHYRQSVKEQREQDLRRHEQQLQQLQAELRQQQQTVVQKQEEATRLNQEGATLRSPSMTSRPVGAN